MKDKKKRTEPGEKSNSVVSSLDQKSVASSSTVQKPPKKKTGFEILDSYHMPAPTGHIKPDPMGSNYDEIVPKPGITVLENGMTKASKSNKAKNK